MAPPRGGGAPMGAGGKPGRPCPGDIGESTLDRGIGGGMGGGSADAGRGKSKPGGGGGWPGMYCGAGWAGWGKPECVAGAGADGPGAEG